MASRRVPLPRLRRVEPVLRRALSGPCALPPGSRVVVAVSGGADSVALLVGLHRIAHEFELDVRAAHLHHGLRGAAADADLAHVRALCARLRVPLSAAVWDTRRRMTRRGLAGQAGLRTLRREFLDAAARRAGAVAIATAHTADDQLETLLMRLARGTGLRGLGGMAPRRGAWIKPLLGATRADIERDLNQAGVAWREDASNQDRGYLRNRFRLDVVPAVAAAARDGGRARRGRAEAPGARAGIALGMAATAAETRSAAIMIERAAGRALERVCRTRRGEISLEAERVASYPLALRRALIRRLWRRLSPASAGLTRHHLESIDGLLGAFRGRARIALPGGFEVERTSVLLHWRSRPSSTRTRASRGTGR